MTASPQMLASSLALLWDNAIEGRRVAVLGAVDHPLTAALLERSPKHVHVFDPDAERAEAFEEEHSSDHVRVLRARAMPAADDVMGVRVASYDTVVVPNADRMPDWPAALVLARRALGFDGVLLAAIRPDAKRVPYTQLFESVAVEFEYVNAYASSAFTAVAHARMGESETDEFSVDPELAEQPEPSLYVIAGSSVDFDFGNYTLVQVSDVDTVQSAPIFLASPVQMPDAASGAELHALRVELAEVAGERQEEVEALELKLGVLAASARELAAERDEAVRLAKHAVQAHLTAPAACLSLVAPATVDELEAYAQKLAEIEGQLFVRDCRIQELEAALSQAGSDARAQGA